LFSGKGAFLWAMILRISQSELLLKRCLLNFFRRPHGSKAGKWNRYFRPIELASYTMTQHEAEAMEELWRCKAVQSGWRVYGLPPGILINPYRRAGLWKRWKARKLVWKTGRPEVVPARFPWKGLGWGLGVMMGAMVALPWALSLLSG